MDISGIAAKMIKLSAHSITLKNEDGKTIGIVRNIVPYTELRTSEQMKYWRKLREYSMLDPECLKRLIMHDGELYYLHNLKPLEFYETYCQGREGFECERDYYEKRKEFADKIAEIATVIPCYIL